jgi:hypothetical protein
MGGGRRELLTDPDTWLTRGRNRIGFSASGSKQKSFRDSAGNNT